MLAACSITPSEGRLFDPDKEFARLDGPDVPTVQQSLQRGAEEALARRDYPRAVGLYQQLIDHDPDNIDYKLGLAESLRRLGEYAPAIEFYDSVTKQQPGHIEALEGKALALMGSGETGEAARVFQQVLKRDATRWRTLNALGILFAVKNMHSEAQAYFREALKHSPRNPSVLNNRALVEALGQDFPRAFGSFEQAARLAEGRQREQVELNHALVLGISGDMKAAEKMAARHLKDGALQNNLGLYAHLSNDRELAKSFLNMALTGTPVYYKRAWENLDIIAREGADSGKKRTGKRFRIN